MIKARSIESLILHVIGFLLVWEWLRPLDQFEGLINTRVFIVFLGLLFLLTFFNIHKLALFFINVVYIVTSVNYIYFNQSLLATLWPKDLVKEIIANFGFLFQAEWLAITDPFRTLLLYVLLWLLVYLLHYWIIIRKKIFFFFLLTVVYLTVIDTFAPYNASIAIIRTFAIGLLAIGILFFYRISESEKLSTKLGLKKKWIWSLIWVVLLSTSIGAIVPKAGPVLPDPLPFLQSYAEHHLGNGKGDGGGISKIGYDEDDSLLGGPFVGDDRVVFTAIAPDEEYWRIETKDLYTGRGWEQSENDNYINIENNEFPIVSVEEPYLSESENQVEIIPLDPKTHVIYPQGVQTITFKPFEVAPYQFNATIEKVIPEFMRDVDSYQVTYRKPNFEIYSLREVKDNQQLSAEFIERYTQLPEDLPERVGELAQSVTESEDNWFGKARAIENYLNSYIFTYDTENVAVPGRGEDYVDQFLFETQIGYCDNFSTSMVVMLRSLGIPARWVKGYTPGMPIQEEPDFTVFEVTNNNAHSWVEAFFPGVGWIPFEPTKGFESPTEFYFDLSKSPNNGETPEPEEQTPPEIEDPNEETPEKEAKDPSTSKDKESNFSWLELLQTVGKYTLYTILILCAAAILLFITRRKWFPYWLLVRYQYKNDAKSFEKAYLSLLTQLKWNGFVIKEGETLRSFAQYVDNFYGSNEMEVLTAEYERVLYRNDLSGNGWGELKNNWEQIMRRLIGKKR